MIREDFVSQLPDFVDHTSRGRCRLTICEDNQVRKIACYLNEENFRIGYRIGSSWQDLYDAMHAYLKREGHIK